MKKQDYLIFFALVALLFAWPGIYQKFFAPPAPPAPAVMPQDDVEPAPTQRDDAPASTELIPEEKTESPDTAVIEPVEATPVTEESLIVLTNDSIRMVVSSRGAAVLEVTLNDYREQLAPSSPPVIFDFRSRPGLTYGGLPELSSQAGYLVEVDESPSRVTLARTTSAGLTLRRTITMGSNYLVHVSDTFVNQTGADLELGNHSIRTGPIGQETAHADMVGMINIGVDVLPPAGGVENWGARIQKEFRNIREEQGLASLPGEIHFRPSAKAADWVAAKNKYFVQILMPDGDGADSVDIFARREITAAELAGARIKDAFVSEVAAELGFLSQTLAPGESYTRTYEYFAGPKSYKILSALSHGREGAMGFEENAYMDVVVVPSAKLLIRLLGFLHDHVYANYGVAIILLTLIVRIVFWPITHKGTESMRRMAKVQPLMTEIREKYKDNPQKMQQAMMALYKEHKINPLGGCLPMLVQIPVFFALFVVLRIAIELRFADFLWISDLSAPERLIEFGFTIPLLGWDALNILPLLMTATMVIQQKMTPTAGDPAQQRIMLIMMPAMMLFFLYNFASGLALYWTTQNVLMIVQQMLYLQRKKKEEAAAQPA